MITQTWLSAEETTFHAIEQGTFDLVMIKGQLSIRLVKHIIVAEHSAVICNVTYSQLCTCQCESTCTEAQEDAKHSDRNMCLSESPPYYEHSLCGSLLRLLLLL